MLSILLMCSTDSRCNRSREQLSTGKYKLLEIIAVVHRATYKEAVWLALGQRWVRVTQDWVWVQTWAGKLLREQGFMEYLGEFLFVQFLSVSECLSLHFIFFLLGKPDEIGPKGFWALLIIVGVFRAQNPARLSWEIHPPWKGAGGVGVWLFLFNRVMLMGILYLALFCTIASFTHTVSKPNSHLAKEMLFSRFFQVKTLSLRKLNNSLRIYG